MVLLGNDSYFNYICKYNTLKNKLIMSEDEQYNEYGIFVGAKVSLKKDPNFIGIVKHIDENLCEITTCKVCWIEQGGKVFEDTDNKEEWDTQWSNKLDVID